MKRTIRTAIAALALTALAAQPVLANPVSHHPVGLTAPSSIWMGYGLGVMICTGLTFGKQDVQAKQWRTTVTHKQRFLGLLGCAFPPIGLAKLIHHNDWWNKY